MPDRGLSRSEGTLGSSPRSRSASTAVRRRPHRRSHSDIIKGRSLRYHPSSPASPLGRIELMADPQMDALHRIRSWTSVRHSAAGFNGTAAAWSNRPRWSRPSPADNGARTLNWDRREERHKLWQARHDALWAILALQPGRHCLPDRCSCVPIPALPDASCKPRRNLETTWLKLPILGHVGDCISYGFLLIDRDDPKDLVDRAVTTAGHAPLPWSARPATASTASADIK